MKAKQHRIFVRICATLVILGNTLVAVWFLAYERPAINRQAVMAQTQVGNTTIIVNADPPYDVVDISTKAKGQYGWNRAALVGQPVFVLIAEEEKALHRQFLRDPPPEMFDSVLRVVGEVRTMDGGTRNSEIEIQYIKIGGQGRWIITLTPLEVFYNSGQEIEPKM